MRQTLLAAILVTTLCALPTVAQNHHGVAEGGDEGDLGTDPSGSFQFETDTEDCEPCFRGLSDDFWTFTLTADANLRIDVQDLFVPGDRYEARINGVDPFNPDEDCIVGRQEASVPPGNPDTVAVVTLTPGFYSVRIRDVAFQCDAQPLLCAASFNVRLTFGAPTGSPPACESACSSSEVPDQCEDRAGGEIPVELFSFDVDR